MVFPRGVSLEQQLGEGEKCLGREPVVEGRGFGRGLGGPNALAKILRPVGHFPPPPPYTPSDPNAPTL